MNYSKIYNPETGKMVTFNSDLGKQILNNYVYQLGGASNIPNKVDIKENWEKYYLGPENPTLIMRVGTMGSGKTSAVNLFLDVAVICDALYVLSNLVSKGDIPELLLSLTYDSTKFDNDQCSVYNYNDQSVEGLISNITSNRVKYTGDKEVEIYEKRTNFYE